MDDNFDQDPVNIKITKLEGWIDNKANDIGDNKEQIEYFRKRYKELNENPDEISKSNLMTKIDEFIDEHTLQELFQGGRRRSSTARKSSSRRGRRSSKKRGTQRKQKRRQRRGSRRAY